jgi:hypothetical protein
MRRYSAVAAAALLMSFAAHAETVDVTQSGFSPVYVGVDYETATVPSNPTTTGGAATTSRAYIARVDLKAPGIALLTTSHSGPLNTTSETISQFAIRIGVRIAINANFFAPCCDAFTEPKTVIGLLVSNGKVVSPVTSDPTQSEAVLAIMHGNQAVIDQGPNINVANVVTAVAGSAIIVKNGKDVSASSPNEGDPTNPNPRTLVGLSDHGRYLYLAVIDGRGRFGRLCGAAAEVALQPLTASDVTSPPGGRCEPAADLRGRLEALRRLNPFPSARRRRRRPGSRGSWRWP